MANRSRPSFDWRRSLQWHLSRSIQPTQDWVVSDANSWRHLDMHVCSVSAFPLRNARSCIAHCLGDYYGRKAHWNCNFFYKEPSLKSVWKQARFEVIGKWKRVLYYTAPVTIVFSCLILFSKVDRLFSRSSPLVSISKGLCRPITNARIMTTFYAINICRA